GPPPRVVVRLDPTPPPERGEEDERDPDADQPDPDRPGQEAGVGGRRTACGQAAGGRQRRCTEESDAEAGGDVAELRSSRHPPSRSGVLTMKSSPSNSSRISSSSSAMRAWKSSGPIQVVSKPASVIAVWLASELAAASSRSDSSVRISSGVSALVT